MRDGDSGRSDGTQLLVSIDAGGDAEQAEIERLARSLRAALLQLDVDSAAPAEASEVLSGAKAGQALDWSTLIVTLAASGGVLSAVIAGLRDWLVRQRTPPRVKVSIGGDTIELEGGAEDAHRQLIQTFISRHGQDAGG